MPHTNVNQGGETFTDVKSIKDRTREAREALGLSQIELAKQAKVSPGTIGNLEAGTRKSPRELLAIAAALKVNAEWLKSGKGPREAGATEAARAPEGAHAELLAFFDELPPLEQAAVLLDVHDRAARVLGDRLLAEKFGVTGYAADGMLPPIYREFERRRASRGPGPGLVPSPLTHRPGGDDDAGEEKVS
jgi:transcriptional regulator with XRE-family HTH domain